MSTFKVQCALWLHDSFNLADELNDGYAWETRGAFVQALVDVVGNHEPLWLADDDTEVCAGDVTEVIAERCDEHGTGLLRLATKNARMLHLSTFAVAGEHFGNEADALAQALRVPLISTEGCSGDELTG